jgi:hypothetical protein
MIQPPKIDDRTAFDLAKNVRGLLSKYLKDFCGWPEDPRRAGAAEALIRIFARYGDLVIDRLNRAPEKNFLAFLDLLGASPLPPQPARVPLTFYLSAQKAGSALVPALTQVAAQPAKGEQQPIIFETERELVVTSAKLDALFVKNGAQEKYADCSSILDGPALPAGQITASFTIDGSGALGPQNVTVTATAGECLPTPGVTDSKMKVSRLSLSSTIVKAGTPLTGTVILSAAAPQDGYLVFLRTDVPGCQIPISITVAPGQDSAAFTIATSDLPGVPALQGNQPIPYILYFGLKIPSSCAVLKQLCLSLALDQGAPAPRERRSLQWEIVCGRCLPPAGEGAGGGFAEDETLKVIPATPSLDGTENLTKAGDVLFENLTLMPEVAVGGVMSRWLRCRLLTADVRETGGPIEVLPDARLPVVKVITTHIEVERAGLQIDRAFANTAPVDLTKDFFPFGEKPRFGDCLYLSIPEAFSTPNAQVAMHINLTNPTSEGAATPIAAAGPRGTKLRWEFWDGETWAELGTSAQVRFPNEATQFSDTTKTLSETGVVSFRFPKPPCPTMANGQTNLWIRVRIISGDYGREAHYGRDPNEKDPAKGYVFTPSTLAPPSISSIRVDYTIKSESPCEAILTYDNFKYLQGDGGGFKSLRPIDNDQPALYFGFTLPANETFSNRSMSLYLGVSNSAITQGADCPVSPQTELVWEYWSTPKQAWTKWTVLDDTGGYRRSGLIRFLAPPDFSPRQEFGRERYWLRAHKAGVEATDSQPRLRCVVLNTTMASQAVSFAAEVLGSSNGQPNQKFHLTGAPVLEGQQLEIREPTMPPPEEQLLIKRAEGETAISPIVDLATGRQETGVRWHEVSNFYGSGPRDRHYLLDRMTGDVMFGDGRNGLVPPVLAGNIRMKFYRTGGGVAGNRPMMSINQLKTTVPYVEKVTNPEAGTGGADAETLGALLERAPREIRHGRRAVNVEDFEDLAMLASPAVARAKCVPLYDLSQDPAATRPQTGLVSLIIVPRSTDSKPLPSLELFERVRSFLDARRTLTADLVLVGPMYIRILVKTEIAVSNPDVASETELAVTLALNRFLHPISGRLDRTGWDFGRKPAESDLYELIEGIRGVSHVRSLSMTVDAESPGAEKSDRFLIYGADQHEITVTLEE